MSFLNKKSYFYFLIIPAVILYISYVIVPSIIAFGYSLTNYQGIGEAKFIGLKNYIYLFRNNYFFISVKNTLIMLAVSLIIIIPLSFLMANLVNRSFKINEFLKVLYFSPLVVAPIITGLVWVFIFDPTIGLVNAVFRITELQFLEQQWIGGLTLTPFSASIVYIWSRAGFYMAVLLAGLKMIPDDFYEASTVDGATVWQKAIYITIPMLYESLKICAVLIITDTFKVFETIYMLTNGGPNHYSESIVTLMYNTTFISRKYGYGMAMAVIEFLLAMTFSLILLRITKKEII